MISEPAVNANGQSNKISRSHFSPHQYKQIEQNGGDIILRNDGRDLESEGSRDNNINSYTGNHPPPRLIRKCYPLATVVIVCTICKLYKFCIFCNFETILIYSFRFVLFC